MLNWRKKHRPKSLQINFWQCARSIIVSQFKRVLKDLEDITKEGVDDLLKTLPIQRFKSFFCIKIKYDMVDNNILETFNGCMLDPRQNLIISLLNDIKVKVITRIEKNNKLGMR